MNFLSFPQSIAQIPAEEFSMKKTCANSEFEPVQENNDVKKNALLVYDNSSLGFSIQYPSDWKRTEEHCTLKAQGLIVLSSNINFLSTIKSKEVGFVGISITDNTFKGSIDTFANIYSKDLANIIELEQIFTFAGLPAAKFVIHDETNHKLNLITIFANDKKYDFTYPLASLGFSDTTIQSVLNSFEIINNTESYDSQESTSEVDELG